MRTGFIGMVLMGVMIISGCSCQEHRSTADVVSIPQVAIHRFDKALFHYINSGDSSISSFTEEYKEMLDVIGQAILNVKSSDQESFFPRLMRYYSEPTLRSLYQAAIETFDTVPGIEEKLTSGFAFLKAEFPDMQIPAVYMHVSGFNQNVLVSDSLLSISIDKYLGPDYPLYKEFFYPDQRRRMAPEFVPQDYLRGWIMSEFPFEGNPNVLLERMVYEGKIRSLILDALDLSPLALFGYTRADFDWCVENEGMVWKSIIEQKRLYTPDQLSTMSYFEMTLNHPFVDQGAPCDLGAWIGWRIVERYRKETGCSYAELFAEKDAQQLLSKSRYKPL